MEAVECERSEGCPCCRARLDLLMMIRHALERPRPPHRLVVVIGADRDLATATQTVLAEPDLQRLVELDAVIATVDATQLATRLAVDLPLEDSFGLERIAVADRVVVARGHHVTQAARTSVLRAVRSLNRLGLVSIPGLVPVDVGTFVDLRAWRGAPHVGRASLPVAIRVPEGCVPPTTVHLRLDGWLDGAGVEEWFDRVISMHAPRLARLQGAVAVSGEPRRIWCTGVRSYAASWTEETDCSAVRTEIALVGTGLDRLVLQEELESARI